LTHQWTCAIHGKLISHWLINMVVDHEMKWWLLLNTRSCFQKTTTKHYSNKWGRLNGHKYVILFYGGVHGSKDDNNNNNESSETSTSPHTYFILVLVHNRSTLCSIKHRWSDNCLIFFYFNLNGILYHIKHIKIYFS